MIKAILSLFLLFQSMDELLKLNVAISVLVQAVDQFCGEVVQILVLKGI